MTPLTLVAKDSNLIFFQEILKKHFRELVWVWGNYASYGTNLAQLDTYRIRRWDRLPEARPEFKKKNRELYLGWRLHNTPHYRSALEIIVNRVCSPLQTLNPQHHQVPDGPHPKTCIQLSMLGLVIRVESGIWVG